MWKVFDMVSNLLFYDHNFSRGWRQSQPPLFWCKPSGEPPASQAIVKIAWAFTPGGAQTSSRVQTTTWWTWRKHLCVAIIELQGETRETVQGGASPQRWRCQTVRAACALYELGISGAEGILGKFSRRNLEETSRMRFRPCYWWLGKSWASLPGR